jgi:CDK inhibitor PHO81
LHYACRHGQDEIARYLLSKGSPPDDPDQDGMTPMTMAVISGKASCVLQLLEFSASVNSLNESYIPLNLACQYSHTEIVLLLLPHRPKIASNSEGLFPLHLAARAGNKEILIALMEYDPSGIDVQDRFSLWSPLFFASSEGHDDCVEELLRAGASTDTIDDTGHSAIYWSAWAGHLGCMNLLFEAGASADHAASISTTSTATMSITPTINRTEDLEIPTLSLPPPIIPSFGHNFLEKKVFLLFRLGGKYASDTQAVHPVLLYNDEALTSAKLTISPKGCDDMVPRSVLLPLTDDEQRSIYFYVDNIETFSIDFELYPTFGSKVIGKASALSDIFSQKESASRRTFSGNILCTLPILDSRLKVIGDISFEFSVIKPFQGVQLEIGGKIETYWKSTQPLQTSLPGTASSLQILNTSQTNQALVTASSLQGQFLKVFVQVTRDLVPVVFPYWRLPSEGLDIGVSAVTFNQFQAIISKSFDPSSRALRLSSIHDAQEAQNFISELAMSLADLLAAVPPSLHLNLQILYPTYAERDHLHIDYVPEVNDFIDSILQAVFEHAESAQTSAPAHQAGGHTRSVIFSSFNPDVCTALNWKQPNCTGIKSECSNF